MEVGLGVRIPRPPDVHPGLANGGARGPRPCPGPPEVHPGLANGGARSPRPCPGPPEVHLLFRYRFLTVFNRSLDLTNHKSCESAIGSHTIKVPPIQEKYVFLYNLGSMFVSFWRLLGSTL
jgi:hypothetical protein